MIRTISPLILCLVLAAAAAAAAAQPVGQASDQVQQACPPGSQGVGRAEVGAYRPGSIVPEAPESGADIAPERAALACITYENAQWAVASRAADVATRIAAAAAGRSDRLGELERDRRRIGLDIASARAEREAAVGAVDAETRTRATDAINARLDALAAELAAVTERIEAEFPRHASVVAPRALSVEETRAFLRPREAMVQVLVNADATYVWMVTAERIAWRRAAALPRAEVAARVERMRQMLANPAIDVLGDAGVLFDGSVAHGLYRDLFGALLDDLPEGTLLFVVTDGPLAGLPLGTLLTRDPGDARTFPLDNPDNLRAAPWLTDRHPIAMLPSVSTLRSLRCFNPETPLARRPAACPRLDRATAETRGPRFSDAADFFGVGDPLLEGPSARRNEPTPPPSVDAAMDAVPQRRPTGLVSRLEPPRGAPPRPLPPRVADPNILRAMPRLRGAEAEMREIMALLNAGARRRAVTLLGADAVEPAVRGADGRGAAALQDALYVSFATHGLLSGETALGAAGLVLTPPSGPGTEDDDGLLSAPEVASLRLRARLVVLSACNTADEAGRPGGEGLPGLASAFLLAGARGLLVSHWPVSDAATARLMTATFARLDATGDAPGGRVEAVRAAMRELRASGTEGESLAREAWAHPAFWGPFSFIGDPG